MNDNNIGLDVEKFVQRAYDRMFDNKIEVRHHPVTSWAQATVSGSDAFFSITKANVITTIQGVQHTLAHANAAGNENMLNDLGNFETRLRDAKDVHELGDVIHDVNTLLDQTVQPSKA